MSDDGALRRFPALILPGNAVKVDPVGNGYRVSLDLNAAMVTPSGSGAPVLLADVLARLVAHDTGTSKITNADDGFFDVPGTGNGVALDDGNF